MNVLEDRLNNAAEESRRQIARVDTGPVTSIPARQRHRRALISTVAVAAVFGVFGATALVMSSSPGLDAASEPTVPATIEAPVAASDTAPATTVAMPTLPPALRGTALTTAWENTVTETMEAAGYEITDMDVFEKEMDRGLVHATFTTVDGNEWALAFGPWRDGEYSDDPSVLQEQFFTEEPGQETAEGLLLFSERSDPSYVYLAMDVGKIAISFQPDVIGSAVPFEDLGALALNLAPIARQLLEADLIEWDT